jgi:hypothetical protein
LWSRVKTQGTRLGTAVFILAALLPLQHSGITLASASRDGVVTAETTTLEYIGTSDPAQLAAARGSAIAPHVVGAAHGRVIPFLTPHRARSRQAAATAAIPRLAGATVQEGGSLPPDRHPMAAGVSLGGFPSLSAADQFTTHAPLVGGAFADLEPPDDAVCAGPNNQVVQLINNVGAVFNAQGTRVQGPFTLESFFHEAPPYSLSDPRCVYDPVAHAFYAEEWSSAFDPFGNVIASHINLAINLSGDATRPWSIFRINAGNANATGCPCLPDYVQLGFDQHGIYLSTDQFSSDLSTYVGARLTVISKSALLRYLQQGPPAQLPKIFTYELTANDYKLQPAVSYDPVTRTDAQQEYFLESLDPTGTGGNQLTVFAFTHEAALIVGASPGNLVSTTIDCQPFAMPLDPFTGLGLAAIQKGYFGAATLDDDGMLQVINAGGALWAVLNTAVAFDVVDTDYFRGAAAWFKLTPSFSGGHVSATIAAQGYVAAPFYYFGYPALMVNNTGRAAMVLSTFQADPNYPYAGLTYPEVGVASGPSFNTFTIVARSPMPDIGFTTVLYPPDDLGGSPDYIASGGRWGDYSAATIDPAGSVVYLNAEWVPGPATRGSEANWGTFMARFMP